MSNHSTHIQPAPHDAHAIVAGKQAPAHHGHEVPKAVSHLPNFVVTPAKLRDALLFRWRLALVVGVILAAIGVGIAFATYKPKYTATTQVRLTSSSRALLPGEDLSRNLREEEFQKTQAHVIKSRKLINEVLKNGGIRGTTMLQTQDDAVVWLEKELQAGFVPGTDIFRLWLTGDYPDEAKEIVNAVMSAYLEQHSQVIYKEQFGRMDDLQKVIVSAESKVKDLRGKLKNSSIDDLHSLSLPQRLMMEQFAEVKREKASIEAEQRRLVAQKQVHAKEMEELKDRKELPKSIVSEHVEAHSQVQKDRAEVERLEAQIKELRKTLTADSPRLKQTTDDLATAKATLEKTRKAAEPEVIEKVRVAMNRQLENARAQTDEKLAVLQQQHQAASSQYDNLVSEAAKIGRILVDPETTRGELLEAEGVLKKLRAEKERLEIEKLSNTRSSKENIKESLRENLALAETPSLNQASLIKNGGIYGLLGLALGLFLVSYFEARFHRVHTSASVLKELGVQTLGVLPLLARKRAGAYGTDMSGDDPMPGLLFTDAVNGICTRFLCDDRLSKKSVLMVTSANEDEGKTTVATQVAMGMARAGRKTLLIDCDFRNPSCHTHLNMLLAPGISELLFGEAELESVLQNVPNSDAKFLSAGEVSPQVAKALKDGRLANLLKQLRTEFDCIIIDSAPTPIVADGLLVGKLVDGVVVVVRAKVTKGPSVIAALDQLSILKIPMLGAVVNANPGSMSNYYI